VQDKRRRKSPSGPKIQYLLHLEECVVEVVNNIRLHADVLDLIETSVKEHRHKIDDTLQSYLDDLKPFKDDLDALTNDLNSKIDICIKMRGLMKDQMEYSNRLRNSMIGILVAIYVPLSFATVSPLLRPTPILLGS
jgi:hypothetical protein